MQRWVLAAGSDSGLNQDRRMALCHLRAAGFSLADEVKHERPWLPASTRRAGVAACGVFALAVLRIGSACHRSRARVEELQRRVDTGWQPPTAAQLQACERIGLVADDSMSRAEIADILAAIAAETRED